MIKEQTMLFDTIKLRKKTIRINEKKIARIEIL